MKESRLSPSDWNVLLLAVVVLANSAAVVFGFRSLHQIRTDVKWAMMVAIPQRLSEASTKLTDRSEDVDAATERVEIDVFSDFACEFCRASALPLDSVRREFKSEVAWRYFYQPNKPSVDTVGFRAALDGVCSEVEGVPWELSRLLAKLPTLTPSALSYAEDHLSIGKDSLHQCLRNHLTAERVWGDLFDGARLDVVSTPTIFVNGQRVSGTVASKPMIELIRYSLAHPVRVITRPASTPRNRN